MTHVHGTMCQKCKFLVTLQKERSRSRSKQLALCATKVPPTCHNGNRQCVHDARFGAGHQCLNHNNLTSKASVFRIITYIWHKGIYLVSYTLLAK